MFRGWWITIIGTAGIWLAVNLSLIAAHNTSWTLLGGLFWAGIAPIAVSVGLFWVLIPSYRRVWGRPPRLLIYLLFPALVSMHLASDFVGALAGQLSVTSLWAAPSVLLFMFAVLQLMTYAALVDWEDVEGRQRIRNIAFLVVGSLPLAGVVFMNHLARQPSQIVAVRLQEDAVEAVALRYDELIASPAMISGCSQNGAPAYAVATIQLSPETHYFALLASNSTAVQGMALAAHEGGKTWECPSWRGWRSAAAITNRPLRLREGGEVDVSIIMPDDAALKEDDVLRIFVCSSRKACFEQMDREAKI